MRVNCCNDVNSFRRFFSDPKLSSQITKIYFNVIKMLAVVLELISCGFDVHVASFEVYAMETARLPLKELVQIELGGMIN